jgi:uncharacterized damage-inducible protein DinB
MSLLSSLQLMSQYNQWMNQKFYQVAQQLGTEKVQQDQGAFFGSIWGILNHIYVADIIWLRRFSQYSQPYPSLDQLPELSSYVSLDQIVTQDLTDLAIRRQKLDMIIIHWCQELKSEDLERKLQYFDTKGNSYHKNFGQLIYHFFNHQTHHRGQASSLISQQGIDVGITDFLKIIPGS